VVPDRIGIGIGIGNGNGNVALTSGVFVSNWPFFQTFNRFAFNVADFSTFGVQLLNPFVSPV
jgi:hypothetical protein